MVKVYNTPKGYGVGAPLLDVMPAPLLWKRAPVSTDVGYRDGQVIVNTSSNAAYMLGSVSAGAATWITIGSGSTGAIQTITGDSGGAEIPSAGNFNILGTANQVHVVGSSNTETISLIGPYTPATYTAHGVLIGEGTSSIVATTPGTNGQVLLGSTGADPAFGTLTTSTGIGFTSGAASLALDVLNMGFKLNSASTGGALVKQNLYAVAQASQTSFSLPATAAVGDMFMIAGAQANTSGWIITQASGQEIWMNTNHTTSGATGTLAGAKSTSVILMCTVTNNEFVVVGGSGVTGLTFT